MNAFKAAFKNTFKNAWMVDERFARWMFPFSKKKRFLRRAQIMGKANVPFSAAITELQARARENHEGVMYATLKSIDLSNQRGHSIERALSGWLSPEEVMLLSAGDKRGFSGYVQAIDQILAMGETMKGIRSALLSAVAEPLTLIAMMYGIMLWLSGSFTGKLLSETHMPPGRLTGFARQFYLVGEFSQGPWAIIAPIIIVVCLVSVAWSFPRWTGEKTHTQALRDFFGRFPPYSTYSAIAGAQWALTLSTLAMAGYPYEEIFRQVVTLSSPWVRNQTVLVARQFARGKTLGAALRASGGRFPSRSMMQDISAFGERPGFRETLHVLAQEQIKDTAAAVNGLALVGRFLGYMAMGGMTLWLYLAFNAMANQVQAFVQANIH